MNTPEPIDPNFEDLNDLPSFLPKDKKGAFFQVPPGYFDTLPEQIHAEIRLSAFKPAEQPVPEAYFESLALEVETGLILDKLSIIKNEPYPVPTDYFEWLPARIQDKLKTHTRAQNRFIWLFQSLRLRYLIPAGVVCLVIALSLHFLLPAPTTAASLTLTDQDKKEVIENPEAFGLEESIVMEQVAAKGKFGEKAIPPEQTEAIDYLLDNNVDINTLPADN